MANFCDPVGDHFLHDEGPQSMKGTLNGEDELRKGSRAPV